MKGNILKLMLPKNQYRLYTLMARWSTLQGCHWDNAVSRLLCTLFLSLSSTVSCFVWTSGVLEKPLEKKAGRKFAPPTAKRLIYFIDDLNMPEVDVYGTVQPHTLIRQHLDYNHW